jgi:hypothetical protein
MGTTPIPVPELMSKEEFDRLKWRAIASKDHDEEWRIVATNFKG